nr:hypothetical protein [Tanacetum cinerariifolium]
MLSSEKDFGKSMFGQSLELVTRDEHATASNWVLEAVPVAADVKTVVDGNDNEFEIETLTVADSDDDDNEEEELVSPRLKLSRLGSSVRIELSKQNHKQIPYYNFRLHNQELAGE